MIDLKKKIEELLESSSKFYHKTANINFKMCLQGQVEAYQDCLNVINNYNIITAPKTIKLSEIVSRLKNELKDYVIKYINGEITVCRDRWCYAVVYIDEDTHNFEFDFHDRFNFPKWLYTLWIAGTIIEDDLKDE